MGAYSNLIQSKYYCRAFNSAIFDGTVRIYFAQAYEAFALKVYFELQKKLEKELLLAKELSKKTGKNIYILVYPDQETLFSTLQLEDTLRPIFFESWEDKGFMYFFAGELSEENVSDLSFSVQSLIKSWQNMYSADLEFKEKKELLL